MYESQVKEDDFAATMSSDTKSSSADEGSVKDEVDSLTKTPVDGEIESATKAPAEEEINSAVAAPEGETYLRTRGRGSQRYHCYAQG